MDFIQIGPLNLNTKWLLILLSILFVYLVIKYVFRDRKEFQKEFSDVLFNAFVMLLFIYKLSIVFFRPTLIVENPLGILYFDGGTKGLIIAVVTTIFYVYYAFKKNKWSPQETIQGIFYSFVTFAVSFWLLRTLYVLFF
ncbi:hypothetical protein SM124_13535 [Bacillus sp. 31A1R]|uniref:Uncharacterized protein n=1 Tax=Robertmurraya mangrovi TaxID=3098077 RepID=A0ABU5J069_9BACI|nr:hypothetical protein [Bacillus sp. 31A1R]MDZ5472750.1 hypothetical protein [Bacillus sp. 31A1R]